jgi:branched-chain amino acid transport system substrate-binding protein
MTEKELDNQHGEGARMTASSLRKSLLVAGLLACLGTSLSFAEKRYGPGVSDTEIKIGQTMPYSGPLSAYATIGKAEAAYFAMVNEQGGINGRKIKLISVDDGYSPPKTVEQIRKLVEQEEVLLVFSPLGTPTNSAIHKYLNANKVPHLFVASGATKWSDPQNFPWTIGWQPNYQSEARIYAKYLLQNKPNAKIAVLYQNDDSGKDYLKGLKDRLGSKAFMIVKEASYEATDPSIDSQIVSLQASGADVLVIFAAPKQAAQAIRKTYDIGWKPFQVLTNVSTSIASVLQPAGLDKSVGLVSAAFIKEPSDPQWQQDKAYRDWVEWMKKYYPDGDLGELFNVYGYSAAQTLVHVLKQCGDELTRENVMRRAASMHNLDLPMLLPGIRVNTSPTDFSPIKQLQMMRFDGKRWVLFGEVIGE